MAEITITVTEKGGESEHHEFMKNEVTIGRIQGNDIVLAKGNISKRHSKFVLRDGKMIIVDLKSTNGTYVNGKRITAPMVLKAEDKVYIGDFTLLLKQAGSRQEIEEVLVPSDEGNSQSLDLSDQLIEESEDLFDSVDAEIDEAEKLLAESDEDSDDLVIALPDIDDKPKVAKKSKAKVPPRKPVKERLPSLEISSEEKIDFDIEEQEVERKPVKAVKPERPAKARSPIAAQRKKSPQLKENQGLHAEVIEIRRRLYLSVAQSVGNLKGKAAKQAAEAVIDDALTSIAKKDILKKIDLQLWKKEIIEEFSGLGALGILLADSSVREIYVNGPHHIHVKTVSSDGEIAPQQRSASIFSSTECLTLASKRLLAMGSTTFDAKNPFAQVRLSNGTLVHAVHHSVAIGGPYLTLLKRSEHNTSLDELCGQGVLSKEMVAFIRTCLKTRRNILVTANPRAEMSAFINALMQELPQDERLVCVEQSASLSFEHQNMVMLSAKSPAKMREVVAMGIHLQPERLLVHEMAGAEALDVMIAMSAGQAGAIASSYAISVQDALSRLAQMITLGDDIPKRVARSQIADSLDVVICLTRFQDGLERVTDIEEVTGADIDLVMTQTIFTYVRDRDGFKARGEPRFYQILRRRGEQLDSSIFEN